MRRPFLFCTFLEHRQINHPQRPRFLVQVIGLFGGLNATQLFNIKLNTKMCQTTMSPVQVNGGKGSALPQPSLFARYSCAALMIAIFAAWGNVVFVDEAKAPGIGSPLHNYKVPLFLTSGYLLSLPLLRIFTSRFLSPNVDVKVLLKETMVIYNGGQVLLNGWMVYKIMDAVLYRDHPFFGDVRTITGASFAVWVHYMDKYLEFFDTFFMVLRGRMDQVRGFQGCRVVEFLEILSYMLNLFK
jgi:hypothetical protein